MASTSTTSRSKRKAHVIESSDENDDEHDAPFEPDDDDGETAAQSDVRGKTGTHGRGQRASHSRSLHALQSVAAAASIRDELASWFLGTVHDARSMPWRKRWDASLSSEQRAQRAYEVWISEIMLQQTRVETVKGYWTRWMEAFPTIVALSESNIEEVNALWKGLGYYSRAARILEGAKIVVEKYDGKLPDDPAVLQAGVPGIGRYSAGAITSIAYGKCAPILDGNVHRLLSRVLALHAPPKSKATTDLLWSAAEAIVKGASDPGAVNQALIEVGSTVCTPKDPKCGGCPIRKRCAAFQLVKSGAYPVVDIEDECTLCEPLPAGPKSVTAFPMKVEKKAVPEETDLICIISWSPQSDSTTYNLLRKRPETGLLAGLWDFPAIPNIPESIQKAPEKRVRALVGEIFPADDDANPPPIIKEIRDVGSVLHVFSHVKKTFQVVHVRLESASDDDAEEPPSATQGDWMDDKQEDPDSADEAATKKPVKKRKAPKKESDANTSSNPKSAGSSADGPRVKWVLKDNVAQENLGTGTMKVWKLTLGPQGTEGSKPKATKKRKKEDAKDEKQPTRSLHAYFTTTKK